MLLCACLDIALHCTAFFHFSFYWHPKCESEICLALHISRYRFHVTISRYKFHVTDFTLQISRYRFHVTDFMLQFHVTISRYKFYVTSSRYKFHFTISSYKFHGTYNVSHSSLHIKNQWIYFWRYVLCYVKTTTPNPSSRERIVKTVSNCVQKVLGAPSCFSFSLYGLIYSKTYSTESEKISPTKLSRHLGCYAAQVAFAPTFRD